MTGNEAVFRFDNAPRTTSRLISSPTRKKKIAIRPSLIQCSNDFVIANGGTPICSRVESRFS